MPETFPDADPPVPQDEPESRPGGVPLYVWVLIAVALAVPAGLYFQEKAAGLDLVAKLIIRALARSRLRSWSLRSCTRSSRTTSGASRGSG